MSSAIYFNLDQSKILEKEIIISIKFPMSSANAFKLDHSKFSLFCKELTVKAPNKPITHFYPRNMTKIIALSLLLLFTEFSQTGQCRFKIRLHVLCSLILIYTVSKNSCSCDRHSKGECFTMKSRRLS